MKQKRLIITFAGLSLLLFLCIAAALSWRNYPSSDDIYAVLETKEGFVGLEYSNEKDYIFHITESGELEEYECLQNNEELFEYETRYLAYEKIPYVLMINPDVDDTYAIVELKDNLKVNKIYTFNDLPDGVIRGFHVEDGMAYVTLLTDDRKAATVYAMQIPDSTAEGKGEKPVFEAITRESAAEGRHFIAANYKNGKIVSCSDAEDFSTVSRLQNYVNKDVLQKQDTVLTMLCRKILSYLIWALIGCVGIGVIYILLFRTRSYGIQRFVISETLLICILIGSISVGVYAALDTGKEDRLENADLLLDSLMVDLESYTSYDTGNEGFIDSNGYQKTFDILQQFMADKSMMNFFNTLAIVSPGSGGYYIDVALDMPRGYLSEDATELSALIDTARLEMKDVKKIIRIGDRQYGAVIRTWNNEMTPNTFLVALMTQNVMENGLNAYDVGSIFFVMVIYIIGTILLIISYRREAKEVRKLSRTMELVCQGRLITWKKPEVTSWDINTMWNSLYEIFKDRERVFYSRSRIFQAYYRFAPRNIEKLFDKEAISEVQVGDSATVEATVALINTDVMSDVDQDGRLTLLNDYFEDVCRNQIDGDGVLVANNSNLSSLKALFTGDIRAAVRFGIDTLQLLGENRKDKQKISIIIHHTNPQYGIAGTQEQAFPFVASGELDGLQNYSEEFRRQGVKLVITDTIHDKLDASIERRYIGYLLLNNLRKRIDCYEVLDVYSAQDRILRRNTDSDFQEGLQLFYQNDFYLARGKFAEVLKVCPQDRLATWYLFRCDGLMDNRNVDNVGHGLFEQC